MDTLFRVVLNKLFGIVWVVLIDSDGEFNFRRLRGPKNFRWVTRFGLGVRIVQLCPDGTTKGASYVERWEPYVGKVTFEETNKTES